MKYFILLGLITIVLVSGCVIETPQEKYQIKKFSSYEELKDFVKASSEMSYGIMGTATMETMAVQEGVSKAAAPTAAEDYSTTNIQVEGVDEADIVKNDGKYIYVVSGSKVIIVDAYPAEDAKILSEIEFNGTPQQIFINKDKLVVFGYGYYSGYSSKIGVAESATVVPPYYSSGTFIKIYDVSDRENPILKRNISLEGNYYNSRMIGDYIYAIVTQPIYYRGDVIPLPVIASGNKIRTVSAEEIYYFDVPDRSYIYTTILGVNTQNDDEEFSSKVFLLGYTQNMFVSLNNIYVTYTKRISQNQFYDRIIDEVLIPLVPLDVVIKINEIKKSNITNYEKMNKIGVIFEEYVGSLGPEEGASFMKTVEEKMLDFQKELAKETEKTVIHKISIDNKQIEYLYSGEVPGSVLNQFSMDEYNDYFRIATTTSQWRSQTSQNHVYVLDKELNIVGKVEDLAQGERIYSVRFIGDKGYMVTFRQIDPLFVIDLKEPANPKVLGYLKIPGVSDYLHPYDETHIIGVGRDATEQGRIQGVKLSLFDITDVENPKEISKYIIGERGTDSDVLRDHKAFLFSKEKSLLVIPVRLSEKGKWNAFQGAYVFNLDLDNGFVLKGKITHRNDTKSVEKYYYDYASQVKRSLYIENILYTISQKMIKMNELENLNETNKVDLLYEEYPIYY